MESIIKEIMSKIFNIPVEQIGEDTSPETVENWDSIRHMNLIVSLEEQFDIEFEETEMANLLSYKHIVMTAEKKLNK